MIDMSLSIVNLPGCTSHVFGSACIEILSHTERYQRCPLCRTNWWSERLLYAVSADEQTKHKEAESFAECWQTDYNTARYMIHRKPEYADIHPPFGLFQLCLKLSTRYWIRNAVVTETVQQHIRHLQGKHTIRLAGVAYDPMEVIQLKSMYDPFTFNNYYLHAFDMSFAILGTPMSQRGQRLWQMYRDTTYSAHEVDSSCLNTIRRRRRRRRRRRSMVSILISLDDRHFIST
jgi:hypothetical protein